MSEKSISWSKVVKRAARDSQFRQDLLANPRETLEKEYGISLPKNVNFVVHEQTEDTVHLVLPPLRATPASAQRYSDDDEEGKGLRYSDDDEANPQRYSDDDEEANPQRYSDDDEEANPQRYSDDDEEIKPQRYSDDDEEAKGSRYSDDDEELKS